MLAKSLLLGAFAVLATAQSAVLTFTRVPNPVTDGEPQAITYATNDTSTPVTIILRQGAAHDLKTVATLTTDANGGQFVWTPPKYLPNGNDYALEIRQGTQVNYFGPLTVQGAIPASVSAHASATSANATKTMMTTTASAGTGTSMSRNGTMVRPTLTSNSTMTKTTQTGMGHTTTTQNAGASSPSGSSPTSTGGASPDFAAHSSFALVFGALAAVFYLG